MSSLSYVHVYVVDITQVSAIRSLGCSLYVAHRYDTTAIPCVRASL